MKKIELFYFFNFDYNQIKKIKIKKGGLKLRAAILEENNVVKIQEIEMPEIKDEDVLVQVKYSGVCGSDIPRLFNNGARFYPIILGHEFSGIVTKVGSKVENIAAGDKVAVAPLEPCMKCSDCIKGHFSQCKHYSFIGSRKQGAWAEYVAVPAKNAVKLPKGVSLKEGAFFEPLTVALHGLSLLDYPVNKKIAILGMGTIGQLVLQCVKSSIQKEITAVDINDEKLEFSIELGADNTYNPLKATGKLSDYDLVIETSGVPDNFKKALEIAGNKGNVLFIGTPHGNVEYTPAEFENINRKELTLTGSWMNYSNIFPGEEWEMANSLFKENKVKIDKLIAKLCTLDEFPKVVNKLGNKEIQGKVVIEF